MISISRIGEVASSSMVPVRFSSANSRMVIIGMKNSPMTLDVREQRPDDILVHVHGEDLAAHLRFHAAITKKCPSEFQKKNPKISANMVSSR